MNKKLMMAFNLLFLAACSLCLLTNVLFPYFMYFMKGLIIIGIIGFIWIAMIHIRDYCKEFNNNHKETIYNLIFREGIKCRIVNLITLYRIIVAPILLILLFKEITAFKWILLSAFISDVLDGFLARRWMANTKLGARLDSLADDILFFVSLMAIIHFQSGFLYEHLYIIASIVFIFVTKILILWCKHYRIISAMHTYSTKIAAFCQALFFLDCIFLGPSNTLFNITAIVTMVAIIEEIIIICAFKELKQNTKGIFF